MELLTLPSEPAVNMTRVRTSAALPFNIKGIKRQVDTAAFAWTASSGSPETICTWVTTPAGEIHSPRAALRAGREVWLPRDDAVWREMRAGRVRLNPCRRASSLFTTVTPFESVEIAGCGGRGGTCRRSIADAGPFTGSGITTPDRISSEVTTAVFDNTAPFAVTRTGVPWGITA